MCAQSKTNSRCTQSLCLTLYHVLADFGIQSDKIYQQRSKRACGDSALNADRRFLYREGGSINCTHSPKITYRQIEALDKLWESISLIPASCAPGSYAPRTQTTNRACQMPQAMARPHNLLLCHHHGSSRLFCDGGHGRSGVIVVPASGMHRHCPFGLIVGGHQILGRCLSVHPSITDVHY